MYVENQFKENSVPEVEFVNAVTAGGTVKLYIINVCSVLMLFFAKKNTYMLFEQCLRGKRKKLRSGSLFPELIRFQRREERVSAREAYFYRRRLGRVREICQLFTVPILPDESKARFAT